jgi:hypothetical protein
MAAAYFPADMKTGMLSHAAELTPYAYERLRHAIST